MISPELQSAVQTVASVVAILTFPVVCLAFFRQSDAFEFDLINKYRTRLGEVQRKYRDAAAQDDATEYEKAAYDLITVFEDLALVINRSRILYRAREYLTVELRSFLQYLLEDARFRRIVEESRSHEGSLDELTTFVKRHARRLGAANVALFKRKPQTQK